MPSLGADMEAGTVTEWLVKPGDEVHRGDIVAVVDTDKADVDVEIFDDGVVEELLVPVGTKVPVGTPLARLAQRRRGPRVAEPEPEPLTPPARAPSAPVTAPAPAPAPAPVLAAAVASAAPLPSAHAPSEAAPAVHSPIVRRHAAELRVDLSTVTGTGPSGTVTRADVERAASGAAPALAPGAATRDRPRRRHGRVGGNRAGRRGDRRGRRACCRRRRGRGRGSHRRRPRRGETRADPHGRPDRVHAARDRDPDGACQPRDPALLPREPRRLLACARVARRRERGAPGRRARASRRCCCSRRPRSRLGRFRS